MTIQTRYAPRADSRVTVICAWCNTLLTPGGQAISHGICEACAANMARSIDALPRVTPAA